MIDFLEIGIIGFFLTLLVQVVKIVFPNLQSYAKQFIAIFFAIALGIIYTFYSETQVFQSITAILSVATLAYEYIVKNILK